MRAAAIQMTSGSSVETNLRQAAELLDRAAALGAELAVLPENFAFLGPGDAARLAIAEAPGDGPLQAFLALQARRLGLWIVGGTLPLTTGDAERAAAACLLYDAEGRQVARYDKIHLFDVAIPGCEERYRESASTRAGLLPVAVDSPAGRLGLAVCYDLRFPELFRRLAADGAATVALPAAFTEVTGRAHWEVLVRARAIENLSHVIAAAQVGLHDNGRETHGDSMIVDAWGEVLARRRDGIGVIAADLNTERQQALRKGFPALEHRILE